MRCGEVRGECPGLFDDGGGGLGGIPTLASVGRVTPLPADTMTPNTYSRAPRLTGPLPRPRPHRSGTVPTAALVTSVIAAVTGLVAWRSGFTPQTFDAGANGFLYLFESVVGWWTWVPITVILLLEWWAPAEPPAASRRIGVVADIGWTVALVSVWAPLVLLVNRSVESFFEGPLSGLRVDLPTAVPDAALFAIGFLLGDFIRWFVHLMFHRSERLWRFHEIHHTQNRMSMWTDFRVHPFEIMARELAVAAPFFMLGGSYSTPVGVIGFAYLWYTVFYHGNIAWNMGPLRWILVTPQSHRVHHSTDPAHFDANFGNVLSIWDRLFGTACADDTVLPPTGLDSAAVPMEADLDPSHQLRAYADQLAYPFR